jgi:outer membrane protein assembly factor BamB
MMIASTSRIWSAAFRGFATVELIILQLLFVGMAVGADELPCVCGWRNNGSGRCDSGAAAPTEWGPEKNIRWKTKLPHRSNASPILVDGRLYVCAEPDDLLCVAADTGRILWQQATTYLDLSITQHLEPATRALLEQARAAQLKRFKPDGMDLGHHPNLIVDGKELPEQLRRPDVHVDAGYTTPTPVSDGRHVFALFATGLVTSFDTEGKRCWTVLPEKPVIRWGQAASPIIAGGRLIVHLEQCYALNLATGEVVWHTPARRRWATPVVLRAGQQELIVLGGGEVLRGSDGMVLADLFPHQDRCDCYVNYWGMSSPIVAGESVYFVDGTPNSDKAVPTVQRFDIKLASEKRVECVRHWRVDVPSGKYFASPVLHDGRLYIVASTLRKQGEKGYDAVLNNRVDGTLLALNAETGELILAHEIGKDTGTYHTISFADGKLWITGHRGITVVLDASPSYREIARDSLEATRSHPLFAGNDLVIRGCENLYRIGGSR